MDWLKGQFDIVNSLLPHQHFIVATSKSNLTAEVANKANKKAIIIHISCPSDANVIAKENDKITKYSGLRVEVAKMWNCECTVIPVVIGGLGSLSHKFVNYINVFPAEISDLCLKITILGSKKIMRSCLSRK